VAIGYERRDFQNRSVDGISGYSVEARLEYFPSKLTTLSLIGRRTIEDGDQLGARAYFLNAITARVDHEFLRNLLGNAQFTYEKDDFKGLDRTDKVTAAQLGVNYFATSRWGVASTLTYVSRRSAGVFSGQTYNDLRLLLSVVLQR
jgi:hypothetical protein